MWFKIENDHVKLRVLVKPNAKKTAILAITEQGLQIAIHAKPHKGAANKELILYLAELFQIAKSKINLVSGEGSRYKSLTLPLTEKIRVLLEDPTKLK